MQKRKVVITWEAIYDVVEMTEYIEANFGISRANHFEGDIKKQMQKLGSLGGVFGQTCLYYRGQTIYKKPFPPSIIFYVIKEPEKEIHILRVLREEQNWEAILTRKQEYTYPR